MNRTTEGQLLTQVILEMFRVNGALLAAGDSLTKPFGLTSARWQVMGPIVKQPLTVAQIARRMGLARQGVQRIVNDLELLGMVTFKPNPDHKRSPLVSVTEAGTRVMVEIDKAQIAWVNKLAAGLTEQQLTQTLTLLETLREQA